jgi:hypothetical protein
LPCAQDSPPTRGAPVSVVAAKMRTREGRDMDGAGAANRFGSETGEVVLDAVMRWREWVHRRVESVQPLDGDRGRIRHSIDCTPPPDARLAYDPRERRRRLSRVEGDAIVPLAMVAKGPMRHLDATGSDGRALPLLTMNDGQEIALSVLTWALGREGIATIARGTIASPSTPLTRLARPLVAFGLTTATPPCP